MKYRKDLCVPNKRCHSDKNGVHVKFYSKDEVDVYAVTDGDEVIYVPFNLGGIFPKKFASSTWNYLHEDFKFFPCLDIYSKKLLLSNGTIVYEVDKVKIIELHNPKLTVKQNAENFKIPYFTYRKWVYKNHV